MRKKLDHVANQGQKSRGFTLVELLFVVTIIGILASIAVPVYRDYSIRTRVTEAFQVFGTLNTAYTIYYSLNDGLPASLSDLENVPGDPDAYVGDYVDRVDVQANGNVRMQLRDVTRLGDAANKIFELQPSVASNSSIINWSVYTEGSGQWIAEKYLPNI